MFEDWFTPGLVLIAYKSGAIPETFVTVIVPSVVQSAFTPAAVELTVSSTSVNNAVSLHPVVLAAINS